MVWAPKYRKMVLRGDLARRLKIAFTEIADRYEFEIDTMEVNEDPECAFVFVSASSVFSGSGCTNTEEHIGTNDFQGVPKDKEATLGWRTLE